jgi:two-component system chemotaxis response regulator CheB
MSPAFATARQAPFAGRQIRVMVVDDAVVARRVVMRWVEAEADMTITAALRTGREAVEQIEHTDPDVVLLDVDMPELDGIAALPLLLSKKPGLLVIMVSTLTRRSAELSMRALSLGATDYIPKPETNYEVMTSADFRRELIEKIRSLGRRRVAAREFASPEDTALRRTRLLQPGTRESGTPSGAAPGFRLRPFAVAPPRVLVIGSSTGGPQALTSLIGSLGSAINRAPVLITQHMPPTFTTVLAEHLSRSSGRDVHEGNDGEPIAPGGIYLAPGGRHMRVDGDDDGPRIALGNDGAINFCKPAVDPLFSSAAAFWGSGTLGLILTGMGSDGTQGAADIVAGGGSVIAQDEATSVVWGMPRAAAQAGLCAAVLPLDQLAAKVGALFSGAAS